jgi:hypothetical protein
MSSQRFSKGQWIKREHPSGRIDVGVIVEKGPIASHIVLIRWSNLPRLGSIVCYERPEKLIPIDEEEAAIYVLANQ